MISASHQVHSTHQTHRTQVLSAISKKQEALNSRIDHSKTLALRFRDDLRRFAEDMPEDVGSRLDWMQRQLSQKGI